MGSNNIGSIHNVGTIGTIGDVTHAEPPGRGDASDSPTRPTATSALNVIFVSSNCEGGTLALDREFNRVHQHVSNANAAWARCLEHWPDASLDQLATRVMRSSTQTILHFGGHGDQRGCLVLRDHRGVPVHVSPQGLSRLLRRFSSKVRLVVLNACFSEVLARELAESIDVVIGMSDAIDDETAILFSQSLYEGLAMNLPVDAAFDIACSLIIARCPEVEHIPSLVVNERVDPSTLTFGECPSSP